MYGWSSNHRQNTLGDRFSWPTRFSAWLWCGEGRSWRPEQIRARSQQTGEHGRGERVRRPQRGGSVSRAGPAFHQPQGERAARRCPGFVSGSAGGDAVFPLFPPYPPFHRTPSTVRQARAEGAVDAGASRPQPSSPLPSSERYQLAPPGRKCSHVAVRWAGVFRSWSLQNRRADAMTPSHPPDPVPWNGGSRTAASPFARAKARLGDWSEWSPLLNDRGR